MPEKDTKNKTLVGIAMAFVILVGFLLLFYDAEPVETNIETELLTEAELEVFSQFEGQSLIFGFARGEELSFRYALREFFKEELSINIEFIRYDTEAELDEAIINGEIDVIINLSNGELNGSLHVISTPIMNTQLVITNRNNPLGGAVNLDGSTVGLIEESALHEDIIETFGIDNFEVKFFDSLDEVLDAVENREVDAFITRMDRAVNELIHRDTLQIEFTFQNKIVNAEFATLDEEFYQILEIFEEIMNSSRADVLLERLRDRTSQNIADNISDYIQNKYSEIVDNYDRIEVGMHNANFPYSFFEGDGTPTGIYIEMLELFQSVTGIEYQVRNSQGNTIFDQLFDDLIDNNIQFVFGIAGEKKSNDLTRVGVQEIQDNIISIQKHGNNSELRGISELTFGIITTQELADIILGVDDVVQYGDYDEAIEALLEGEIDVLIGRESVLAYYRDVRGVSNLSQTNHINRFSSHGIIGNTENAELNAIMSDISRLFPLVHMGQADLRWENRVVDYQGRYADLRRRQERGLKIILVLTTTTGAFWFFKKDKENKRLKQANEKDHLTGLYNKHTYERKCKELIEKHPDTLGVFFFIDLDDFKNVNDIHGHEVGDKMIIKYAEILKKVALKNPNTICFRIAGDEFGIFSIGYRSRDDINHLVVNMKERLKGEVMGDATTAIQIKFSAGGSIYNIDTTDFNNLRKYADFAMLRAKEKKNNAISNVELFNLDELRKYHKENLSSNIVDSVLEARQTTAVYQPVRDLNVGEIYGYEGRSRTENLNVTSIVRLIEMAEGAGKIDELDLLMMEEVLRNFKGKGNIFINMLAKSPKAVTQYVEKMVQIAEEIGISVENIVLELSEKTKWDQESIQIIKDCRTKYKFQLAIDDFGVGFASNAVLLDVQPDIVKIDRYFIEKIHEDKRKYSFVKLFIEILKTHDMIVVCKGIEEQQELEVLRDLGSDYGQGFLLGKPE